MENQRRVKRRVADKIDEIWMFDFGGLALLSISLGDVLNQARAFLEDRALQEPVFKGELSLA
jgi:hypothetical protein